jgi:hypothetical protein
MEEGGLELVQVGGPVLRLPEAVVSRAGEALQVGPLAEVANRLERLGDVVVGDFGRFTDAGVEQDAATDQCMALRTDAWSNPRASASSASGSMPRSRPSAAAIRRTVSWWQQNIHG